jgi:hypothetical protein
MKATRAKRPTDIPAFLRAAEFIASPLTKRIKIIVSPRVISSMDVAFLIF